MLNWARAGYILLPFGLLAGCAAPPPSAADQANLTNCTQQADAVYRQENLNGLARTSQNGLYFAPQPNHVFDAQRAGTLDARNNQIHDCEENGSGSVPGGAPLPAPQIIDPSQH